MASPDPVQDRVLAFLADPASHGGKPVHRIDTHAASVFLAGERALKVKRAVRFPFLDYSALDKRHAACAAEIAVNRPFAPMIYRGVVAITQEDDGTLAIAGRGQPIEWAVEMWRFDEMRTLDHVAAAGRIDAALADALGRVVAAAHLAMPPVEGASWIAVLGDYIEEHAQAFQAAPELLAPTEVDAFAQAQRAAYAAIRPLLAARDRARFIRRIHGDLHLGNIVLIDGRPVPFDAIEFSDIIATGDLLYDLAFLLMDLIARDLRGAANIVLNRYLTQMHAPGHLDALKALPFFLAMRAAIRAKVTLARYHQVDASERDPLACAAQSYFKLAQRLQAPPRPCLVAVGGLSGTGKSVLTRELAPELGAEPGAVVLRSDVARKTLFGVAETEGLPPRAYQHEISARVYAALAEQARRTIAAGHAVVVDAVYADPAERAAITAVAKECAVAFHGLFLEAPLALRVARVGARSADASDADAAVARAQEHYALGALDWRVLDASGTPADTLARARDALRPP